MIFPLFYDIRRSLSPNRSAPIEPPPVARDGDVSARR
jgi:hypothetical protein